MLQALITSKTRVKLLMKFFLNSRNTSYLRDRATEFGESTNAIRLELNHLEEAGLLHSRMEGNKKIFQANCKHPLFSNIHNLLLKHTGIDRIVENVVSKLGGLHRAYVVGSFARGIDNPVIDLLLTGNDIDTNFLLKLIEKAEGMIDRKIRFVIISPEETEKYLGIYPEALLLWQA
jgi:predicted nucleotidyltransferase